MKCFSLDFPLPCNIRTHSNISSILLHVTFTYLYVNVEVAVVHCVFTRVTFVQALNLATPSSPIETLVCHVKRMSKSAEPHRCRLRNVSKVWIREFLLLLFLLPDRQSSF